MKNYSQIFFYLFVFQLITSTFIYSQEYKIVESENQYIIVEFNYGEQFNVVDFLVNGLKFTKIVDPLFPLQNPGDPFLPTRYYDLGIPFNSNPTLKVLDIKKEILKDKFVVASPDSANQPFELLKYNQDVYSANLFFPKDVASINSTAIFRFLKTTSILVTPFQFNPVERTLVFNKKILVRIDFNIVENYSETFLPISDKMTQELVKANLINKDQALDYIGKITSGSDKQEENYWYDANKTYYKIYLKEKGVYRITYDQLLNSGIQIGSNPQINKLEIYNNGEIIPIDLFDNDLNGIFNQGDYFQFVGNPPKGSPNCNINIYNLSNVYWFSFQSDSSGEVYKKVNGVGGIYTRNYDASLETVHFEVDSIYEPLGYSPDAEIDHWFWGRATYQSNQVNQKFEFRFDNFPDINPNNVNVNLKVGLQGMTNYSSCSTDHKAYVSITGQEVGNLVWDGQSSIIFDRSFNLNQDSIFLFPSNLLQVDVRGDLCSSDDIRINWASLSYWKYNRVHDKYFNFKNYDLSGVNHYVMWQWQGSDMHIYIPEKGKKIYFPNTDQYVAFWDTLTSPTEYFCIASDEFKVVDSITLDNSSDLRNIGNGADYIIITHTKFQSIADQLATFRANHFSDENIINPRIKIVDVDQIYDEFSYGLLDPFALQKFVKYSFESWTTPAPSYLVLIGDMSHDYRSIQQTSRPNYIPSIPFFASGYGEAASDNMIVAVSGTDIKPDLALGRISIETIEEGNIILQKIMNYPSDDSKPWKQNILLLASGLGYDDQISFGFNQASLDLRNYFISKKGFRSSFVFNFPDTLKPEQMQYKGGSTEIRQKISEGSVLVNYYGHGGGYQWDLVFVNDDIYTLENQNRLPLILSVTCYTAHFDNQNVFGEQFNKVEGKGSVGFLGSSGLTYWNSGVSMNHLIFGSIFNQQTYITGKFITYAKNQASATGTNAFQIALLTYLGDPLLKLSLPTSPDFELLPNNLTITPQNPIVGDSINVKLIVNNWGTNFIGDSVSVELFAESSDTSYTISSIKIGSFALKDSINLGWVPNKGGFYTISAKINMLDSIQEMDYSDNSTSNSYIIFNISDPSILKPVDGYVSENNQIEFIISDIGYYINKDLKYIIEIDTSLEFNAPVKVSGELSATKSIIKWNVFDLAEDTYFWRTRIFDGNQYGRWSDTRGFSLNTPKVNGYYAHKNILKTFDTYNINYSNQTEGMVLNTDSLPARPSNLNLIEDFFPNPELPDSLHLTALTTDGTYLYFGNIWATAGANEGKSRIYKVGTGNNGTTKGQLYGPISDFRDSIKNSIAYHSDGNIYVAIGYSDKLVRINVINEMVDTINIPVGLLRWDKTVAIDGPVYITSDGQYIYNLTSIDSLGNRKFTVRTLDPSNGWSQVGTDQVLDGFSFEQGFTGYFVHGSRLYVSEYFSGNYMRRYRLSDGFFEEEWKVIVPGSNFKSYYSWCNDWTNDDIFSSVYRSSGFEPMFSKFPGFYIDANGTITSKAVGPVSEWNYLKYNLINPSSTGSFENTLLGFNSNTKLWDTLQYNIPDSVSLTGINKDIYRSLKVKFDLSDSTFNLVQPLELKSVHFNYVELSDLYLESDDIKFENDSLLQGLPIATQIRAKKIGLGSDSLNLILTQDSTSFTYNVKANPDTISDFVVHNIETSKLIFENKIDLNVNQNSEEYYYYNNRVSSSYFITRDSVKPNFTITFDDKELIDGDIISSEPTVIMTVEDNSPLPITQNHFSIQLDNIPLSFYDVNDSLKFTYTPYPNSKAVVTWTPKLEDGSHTLTVFVKDSSGNPFNSSQMVYRFNVFNNPDLLQVYNYPNPFKDKTDFTFEVRGVIPPEELKIKIFTVAGRLIKEIVLPGSSLQIGFNRIPWDGLDQDGDEIANGVYFYKIISKHGNEVKTVTQKLAKLK